MKITEMPATFAIVFTLIANAQFAFGGIVRLEASQWHVLAVGVDRYQAPHALRGARADVEALGQLLEARGARVQMLFNPTREALEREVRALAETAGEDDLVMLFFAGHAKDLEGGGSLLLPRALEHGRENISEDATVSARALAAWLESAVVPPERRLVVVDGTGYGFCSEAGVPPPWQGICAGEAAFEWPLPDGEGVRGLLSMALERGLRGEADADGDGQVRLWELASFVRGGVSREVMRSAAGPAFLLSGGDLVLSEVNDSSRGDAPADEKVRAQQEGNPAPRPSAEEKSTEGPAVPLVVGPPTDTEGNSSLFQDLRGRWTWAGDTCESGQEIVLVLDNQVAVFRLVASGYGKASAAGLGTSFVPPTYAYRVLAHHGNEVTMFLEGENRTTEGGDPVVWVLRLLDEDTFVWRATHWSPGRTTGPLKRCYRDQEGNWGYPE